MLQGSLSTDENLDCGEGAGLFGFQQDSARKVSTWAARLPSTGRDPSTFHLRSYAALSVCGQHVLAGSPYGNQEVIALLDDVGSEDGFIDVGANIGLTTCFAASRGAAVLSFEPSAREFVELQRNCEFLAVTPVCLPIACSDRSDFVRFRIGHLSHSGGNSIGEPRGQDEKSVCVPTFRLDEFLTSERLQAWPAMQRAYGNRTLVVKIDVEGFEASVLRGMTGLLEEQRCRKVIVEVNATRATSLHQDFDIDGYMAASGYHPTVPSAGRTHFDQCFVPA